MYQQINDNKWNYDGSKVVQITFMVQIFRGKI